MESQIQIKSIPTLLEVNAELASRTLLDFTTFTMPEYEVEWFHEYVCNELDNFLYDPDYNGLIICMPPQHGKSEMGSRRFPAYAHGKFPDLKIASVSYSTPKARGFNREVQRIIDTPQYKMVFPNTTLSGTNIVTDRRGSWLRNADCYEVVDHKGKYIGVGVRGPLTGEPVDLLLVDDIVKDRVEAMSPVTQLRNIDWWDSVAVKRLHNKSKVCIINTRWDPGDLIGRILRDMRAGGRQFKIINIPRIKEGPTFPEDKRKKGEVLWESKHSLVSALQEKKSNPTVFRALEQQDPSTPKELTVFGDKPWNKIKEIPADLPRFYGLDFGYSNGVDALIECALDKKRKQGYVKEHIYSTGLGTQKLHDTIRACGITHEPIYADHEDPRLIDDLRDMGLRNLKACIKGPGSVMAGIVFLKDLEMNYVDTSLNLEFELNNYQWILGPDGPINEPLDKHNHAIDATRYGFYTNDKSPDLKVYWV